MEIRETRSIMNKLITLVFVLLVGVGSAVADEIVLLPLAEVANASRLDANAADGKGGWLDLGSNDLRVLPHGKGGYGGVPFEVAPCADETAKSCLVLGRTGEETVTLKTSARKGGCLYLLHAVAGGLSPDRHEAVAQVRFVYADGSKTDRNVRTGRDVADWTDSHAYANAARAWTAYNGHTQVSLFVSAFSLDDGKTLSSIRFKATGKCPWMILAATTGERIRVEGVRSSLDITDRFSAPPARTKRLGRGAVGRRPKNVILLIGDGMGPNCLRYASLYQHGRESALQAQQMPVAGLCTTRSADSAVTDSAAAATALATGTKTSNGVLGLGIASKDERKHPRMLVSTAEKAHAAGLAVALLTNERITGATPGAFYAHVEGRGSSDRIAVQAAASGYELFVGSYGGRRAFLPETKGGGRKDGRDILAEMERNGYVCVTSQQAFVAAPASAKVIGFFLEESQPEASEAAALRTALKRVGDAPKGFFMMSEVATTDHGNHGNKPALSVKGALQVDWAVAAALDFAEARGDTLVLVTADHETGGISAIRSPDGEKTTVHYSSSSHTALPVALYAYGPGAECFEGLIDNTDVAKTIQRLLGL